MTKDVGNFVSFAEFADQLPDEYNCSTDTDLPTASERVVIGCLDRFYDFFQIVYVNEEKTSSRFYPDEPGWYWVTYFYPRSGFGYIGPFTDEARALNHACAHALPMNDPRRKVFLNGFIGNELKMCCSIPRSKE